MALNAALVRKSCERTRRGIAVALAGLTLLAAVFTFASPASALNPCSEPMPPPRCTPPVEGHASVPAAPSGLVVSLLTPTSVTVRWQDNSVNESAFVVTRYVQGSTNGGTTFIAAARSGSGGTRTYTDTTASAGGFYTYAVQAEATAAGKFPSFSAQISLTVNTPPLGQPVDLSTFMPAIGDQGGVNSCSAWAADYYLRGWYAKRDGYYPSGPDGNDGFEPMYTYAQYQHNNPTHNGGTTIYGNLTIQLQNGANGLPGLDTRADYSQGDFDSADLPTSAEATSGARYRIAQINDYEGPNLGTQIKNSLTNGQPMAINISIFPSFMSLVSSNWFVQPPTDGAQLYGSHSVFAYKYDSSGVWIANQWGTGWGLNGTAELSWAYVNEYVNAADSIVPVTPQGM
jgi:hypothetical protein